MAVFQIPRHACAQMLGQKLAVEGVDGGVDGGGLRQDIVAVGVGFHHRLQPADLALNAAQPVEQLLFFFFPYSPASDPVSSGSGEYGKPAISAGRQQG